MPQLRAAGVGVAAITPDSPDVLRRFASSYAIDYPLLGDIGGRVIDTFGLLNPNIVPNERQAPGIPFPGHFLLDVDGRVMAKSFTGDLRHRPSGTALVAEHFGHYEGPHAVVETEEIRAVIRMSTNRLFGGQEAAVRVDLDIAVGWHVYAPGVEPPYRRLEVDLEGDLLASQTFQWPAPDEVRFDALDATLPVYDGRVRATGRLRLRWSPPPSIFGGLDEAVRRRAIAPGTYALNGVLRYQACRDDLCLEPRELRFTLPIEVEPTAAPPRDDPPVTHAEHD